MARYRYLAFGLASVLTGFMLELAMNLDQTGCQRHSHTTSAMPNHSSGKTSSKSSQSATKPYTRPIMLADVERLSPARPRKCPRPDKPTVGRQYKQKPKPTNFFRTHHGGDIRSRILCFRKGRLNFSPGINRWASTSATHVAELRYASPAIQYASVRCTATTAG